MEKEFVNYELALRMKQLGFDERCIMHWWKGKLSYYQMGDFSPTHTSAPTFSQVFRWFREKYNIHSFIIPLIDEVGFVYKYQARVHTEESAVKIIGEFETYEEAELDCLEKLIEIVEQKEK